MDAVETSPGLKTIIEFMRFDQKDPSENLLDSIHFNTTQLHGRNSTKKFFKCEIGVKGRERKLELVSPFLITSGLMNGLSTNARIGVSLGQALAGIPVLTNNGMSKYMQDLIMNYKPKTIFSFTPRRKDFDLELLKRSDAVIIEPIERVGGVSRCIPEIRKGKDILKLSELMNELVGIPVIYRMNSMDLRKDVDFILVSNIDSILIDSNNLDLEQRPDVRLVTSLIHVHRQMEIFKNREKGVKVIANGPIRDTNDILKYLAMGADIVGIDDITRKFLRAYISFKTGENDLDDQDLIDRDDDLDWAEIGEMFGEFISYLKNEMFEKLSLLNIGPEIGIGMEDINTSDYNTASITGLPLQGFGSQVPIWRHRS